MSSDMNGSGNSSTVWDELNPPANPDVTGVAVCVTNVFINLCLRILITWSPEDVGEGVCVLLLQVYSILLSTFISVNRNQLSIDDANFVLSLTSPSLMIYIAAASLGDLCRVKTGLYKRIKHHRPFIRVLGALVPFLWLALSAIIAFSGHAFTDSSADNRTSFREWLKGILSLPWNLFLGWGPVLPILCALSLMAIAVKRWSQIAAACTTYLSSKKSKAWKWFFAPWAFVKYFWFVTDHRHKSFVYMLYACLDIFWATAIISEATLSDRYVFGYGQALAIFSSVSVIIPTIKFLKVSYQRDNFSLENSLRSLVAGSGFSPMHEKPEDLYVWDSRLPFTHQMSLLPGFYSTMEQARTSRNGDSWPYTGSETSREVPPGPVPEQSLNTEDSAAGLPPSASPERVQPPRSFDTDIPLAADQDISLALSSYTTTVETIESICKAHKLSPLAAELVVERLREKLSLVHRRLRDRDVDSNERSPSAAPPNAVSTSINVPRRAGTYG